MGSKTFLAVTVAIALIRIVGEAREDKKSKLAEQKNFSIETGIEKPVPLPSEVLQLLKKDENALESSVGCTDKGGGPNVLKASWFAASEVHLAAADEIDLVILAANSCLNGAHAGPFWVARKLNQHYQLVLSTGGDGLSILQNRSNAFRDISRRTVAGGTIFTTIYRFDGQHYQEYSNTSRPIGED